MFDDLDDLLEDNPKPKTTAASKAPLNKLGGGNNTAALKDDFDDFEDFENDKPWGPVTKSASNAKPPTKIDPQRTPTDPKGAGNQWWGGAGVGSKSDLKPSGSKTGLNSSFGGSQGHNSRKSKAEEEADELDAMLGDVLGENPG